jgi:Spy/CpxP family protein refolding chaperone
MVRTFASRVLCWAILVSLAVALVAVEQPALAADGAGTVKRMLSKQRRLPRHYAQVVTETQRETIYKIQEEYQPKLDALEAQMKTLTKERDQKIEAVLTPEQKKKIDEASGKAKDKSAEKAVPAPAAEPKPSP